MVYRLRVLLPNQSTIHKDARRQAAKVMRPGQWPVTGATRADPPSVFEFALEHDLTLGQSRLVCGPLDPSVASETTTVSSCATFETSCDFVSEERSPLRFNAQTRRRQWAAPTAVTAGPSPLR